MNQKKKSTALGASTLERETGPLWGLVLLPKLLDARRWVELGAP